MDNGTERQSNAMNEKFTKPGEIINNLLGKFLKSLMSLKLQKCFVKLNNFYLLLNYVHEFN